MLPKVVEPRLIARAISTADTGMLAQVFESLLHELNRYRPAPTQDEERCGVSLRVASLVSTRGILHHDLI